MEKVSLSLFAILLLIAFPTKIYSQINTDNSQEYFEAIINSKKDIPCTSTENIKCYQYELQLLTGPRADQIVTTSTEDDLIEYSVGESVFVIELLRNDSNNSNYVITGPIRDGSILLLVSIFVIATLIVGGVQGFGSLIGLATSVLVLFAGVIPAIISGIDPIIAGFVGSFLVLALSIFLSHGFNSKSLVALFSTFIGLTSVSILAILFINASKLTGFGDDESYFLVNQLNTGINMSGILFASIIVAGVGIMDDVTVNQVSSLQEIYKANPNLSQMYLFRSSMNIGKDHIASMVNTLFIAYAGASMPLVMLMSINEVPLKVLINNEIFAEEIIRTFIGSIGLILVVPITSYITSYLITMPNKPKWLFRDLDEVSDPEVISTKNKKSRDFSSHY